MSVTLTERAAGEVKRIIESEQLEDGIMLRVGVKGGGCSGFSYSLGWDNAATERDRVAEFHGIKLAVEKKFDPYLDGTVIDFFEDPQDVARRGFVFENPNVKKSCGCGSSFQV